MSIPKTILLCSLMLAYSLLGQSTRSLYSDLKAHQVGDLLSVIIVETANASRESKSRSSSQSDWEAGGSITGDLFDLTAQLGMSSSNSNSFDGADGTEQRELLTGRISVRIVEKTEAGIFRIEGERKVEVNGETNLMKMTGWVRPRDIMADNTVYSYHIADARITYKKGGFVNGIVKPGTVTKLFTKVLGGVLIAVAVGALTL